MIVPSSGDGGESLPGPIETVYEDNDPPPTSPHDPPQDDPEDDDFDDPPIRRRRKSVNVAGVAVVGVLLVVVLVAVILAVNKKSRIDRIAAQPDPKVTAKQSHDQYQSDHPARRQRFEESDTNPDAENARLAAGAAVGVGSMVCVGVVVILLIVSAILMAVWVVKDCRNRSVENGLLWMFLIMGTHIIGLMVYLASRPNGMLIRCEKCGNLRLPYVGVCPHCHRRVRPLGRGN